MRIIYFDICSIPLFLMLLFVCYTRKMNKGRTNQLFISLVFLSLFCAIADLGMEIADNMVPLSNAGYMICNISAYIYLILRNATNLVLLLFLLTLTRATRLIRRRWIQILFCLPYACILILLIQNPFTHSAFIVTAEHGYTRGPLMMAFYGIALLYGLAGLAYCFYIRRYLPLRKWSALIGIYFLAYLAVFIQFFRPDLLLEMFCTGMGEMLIMLSIMRPEERMDVEVGMLSWTSYQSDIRNIIRSGERVKIVAIRLLNSREIRNYLGDHKYNKYVMEIADAIRSLQWKHPYHVELYYERPGIIYLIVNEREPEMDNIRERMLARTNERLSGYAEMGVRFDAQVCLISCPDDVKSADDIFILGHKFQNFDNRTRFAYKSSELVHSPTFAIEAHIEEILSRAIRDGHIEMYYQPIYDVRSGSFRSAEALARIIDPEYGLISPAIFIPAAETQGFIIPIGDVVMDQVFRFISENDLDAMGLDYIEINLSVAQCMESSLPDKIRRAQEKYGVDPGRVNLEITETMFGTINEVMMENVGKLIDMGYSFALDDYGIGYSSMQRVNHIPLALIKIDKSMLDESSSENGRKILEYTVQMMQSIGKQLVAEGAETSDTVDLLKGMNCDYIQGFYFARPMPAENFVSFVQKQNA